MAGNDGSCCRQGRLSRDLATISFKIQSDTSTRTPSRAALKTATTFMASTVALFSQYLYHASAVSAGSADSVKGNTHYHSQHMLEKRQHHNLGSRINLNSRIALGCLRHEHVSPQWISLMRSKLFDRGVHTACRWPKHNVVPAIYMEHPLGKAWTILKNRT